MQKMIEAEYARIWYLLLQTVIRALFWCIGQSNLYIWTIHFVPSEIIFENAVFTKNYILIFYVLLQFAIFLFIWDEIMSYLIIYEFGCLMLQRNSFPLQLNSLCNDFCSRFYSHQRLIRYAIKLLFFFGVSWKNIRWMYVVIGVFCEPMSSDSM